MTFSETKYHTFHIGNSKNKRFSILKVQNKPKNKETTVTYLEDHVNATGTVKATVEEKQSKAFGISAEILSIANSGPGIMLRQAMLVNETQFNSECWQGTVVDKEIKTLSKPDKALLLGLVSRHAKVPLEFLFLETGCVPVSVIHSCQRLVYLQTILKKEPNELLSRVYFAQKADSLPGDYCWLVAEDPHMGKIGFGT